MLARTWGVGQVLWTIVWVTLFVIWLSLLLRVFVDIFRSDDLGGVSKALWALFVIVFPYLGVFVYVIARGHKMSEHAVGDARARDQEMRAYIQDAAGGAPSPTAELERLGSLKERGLIDDAEFQRLKSKIVSA